MGMINKEIARQLIRSSGSVGANYIEANESLGRKDFAMRIKICRKESKESIYRLRLLEVKIQSSERNVTHSRSKYQERCCYVHDCLLLLTGIKTSRF